MQKLKLFYLFTMLFFANTVFSQNHFITTWETTTTNETITIPTFGAGYNYDIDWENDGVFDTIGATGNATYAFSSAGIHTIAIRGDFPRIYFNNSGDKLKINSVEQWGNIVWTSMESAFYGCNNLIINTSDSPDLSNVTNMSFMFKGSVAFNQPIEGWNVSNVTNMSGLFSGIVNDNNLLNQPIENWNVSNVTDMSSMFDGAVYFNQPIGDWNVSNVTNMSRMFYRAGDFNQPIGNWNLSSVLNTAYMFKNAFDFNQPIGGWDVSSVTNMRSMFGVASSFNQPIENWDVSNVTSLLEMFVGAQNFNQPLNNWNVSDVTHFGWMFKYALSFNQPLNNWDVGNATHMGGMFEGTISFNQPIGNWNVSNVTNMYSMFRYATAFNQDISNWDVSSVNLMFRMFENAQSFNQPIGNWNVSNVHDMQDMFKNASAFDQPIGNWNVSNVIFMDNMFLNVTLSTENYDDTLIGWSNLTLKNDVNFHGGNSNYCNGEANRNNIIDTFNWTISDDGLDCSGLSIEEEQLNITEIYPNPVSQFVYIKNYYGNSIVIYSTQGQKILHTKFSKDLEIKKINISHLAPGLYFLQLKNFTRKLVIE